MCIRDRDKVVYSGPNYLMFSDTLYTYAVQETNEIFNVPVSATVPADYDRTFGVEVIDKESNAVEGKHYKILSNKMCIRDRCRICLKPILGKECITIPYAKISVFLIVDKSIKINQFH